MAENARGPTKQNEIGDREGLAGHAGIDIVGAGAVRDRAHDEHFPCGARLAQEVQRGSDGGQEAFQSSRMKVTPSGKAAGLMRARKARHPRARGPRRRGGFPGQDPPRPRRAPRIPSGCRTAESEPRTVCVPCTTVKARRSGHAAAISSARTSAPGWRPKVRTRPPKLARMARTLGSSALRTASPSEGRARTSLISPPRSRPASHRRCGDRSRRW